MSCLVGVDGLEPSTSSLSGNLHRGLCFRIIAISFGDWSTHVRWCPALSAAIVTQLVTHYRRLNGPSKQCQPALDSVEVRLALRALVRPDDPLLVSYRHAVGRRRSPWNLASLVTRSIGWSRMPLWSTVVVSIYSRCSRCRLARSFRSNKAYKAVQTPNRMVKIRLIHKKIL